MIKFEKKGKDLFLIYSTYNGSNEWVFDKIKEEEVIFKKTFFFKKEDLLSSEENSDDPVKFIICSKDKNAYFKIPKRILNIEYDLYIHETIEASEKTFFLDDGISIFKNLNGFNIKTLYIGGRHPEAISKDSFKEILKSFPNRYEKKLYIKARVDSILRNYFDTGLNSEKQLKGYLNKKTSIKGKDLSSELIPYELEKYELILKKLKEMLISEQKYNEHQWQEEILEIILLLYPKYIYVFKKTPVKDSCSGKRRELDFLLIDTAGNIDIIEIKQPFDSCIVTKNQYRDNYIPLRELSGTVMQVEKYLFYLKSWGTKGERYLTSEYKDNFPKNFKLQITNPSGLIIMGRETGLTSDQLRDFEIIKRQYKNVIDIITYDDLLRRLSIIITYFKEKA